MTSDASHPAAPAAPPWDSEDWLTDLFRSHSRAVLAYARRRLDSAEDAEDVVVEVFATAWRRRESVPAEALPWLYATAGHVIAHVIRSDARRTRLGARLATVSTLHSEHSDHAADVVDAMTAADVVTAALDDLAESDAELLRLWAWEQLDGGEIAEVLGCSPGTARTRLHRARARLREALSRRGVTDAELGSDDGPDVGPEAGPAHAPTASAGNPPGPTRRAHPSGALSPATPRAQAPPTNPANAAHPVTDAATAPAARASTPPASDDEEASR